MLRTKIYEKKPEMWVLVKENKDEQWEMYMGIEDLLLWITLEYFSCISIIKWINLSATYLIYYT